MEANSEIDESTYEAGELPFIPHLPAEGAGRYGAPGRGVEGESRTVTLAKVSSSLPTPDCDRPIIAPVVFKEIR
jgi:hypothetical protein